MKTKSDVVASGRENGIRQPGVFTSDACLRMYARMCRKVDFVRPATKCESMTYIL